MAISELLLNLVFYIVAAAAVGGGLAVALSKNIVRSAFALLTVLFSVAAVYALVRADFIVAAQILIYVGGILVLIIFAIMLTHKITDVKLSNESSPGPVSVTACACVFILIVTAFVYGFKWDANGKEMPWVNIAGTSKYPMEAQLSMWQGNGRTGVNEGGTILDGFVRLRASFRSNIGLKSRAQFVVTRLRKDGSWEDLPPTKPVRLTSDQGVQVATADFERLDEGKYRWKVRLVDDESESPWAEFGTGDAPDFTSEKGLTRALGRAFMGPYLLAFEIVSVLLLAALVGAAFLARKEVRE
jgi:NADH:ubiquinone oxidoreductase subunit 6 (subunit J)